MRILTLFITLLVTFGLVGNVSAVGFFGAQLPPLPVAKIKAKQAKAQEGEPVMEKEEEEEEGPRDFIDPQEIKNEIRQTKDQEREVKRVLASAKRQKMEKELGELNELLAKVLDFRKQLQALKSESENAREVLDEYRESQLWDVLQDIRRRVELPRELKDIEKALRRAEKLLKQKQVQKAFDFLGGNIEGLQTVAASMRTAYDAATQAMANGDTEAVDEALMDIREGGHPGELEGMLHGMGDFARRLKMIRDVEIQGLIKDFIRPVVEAMSAGDIREARMTIEELGPQIEKLMRRAMKVGKKERKKFIGELEKLEALIETKLQEQGEKEGPEKGPEGPPEEGPQE